MEGDEDEGPEMDDFEEEFQIKSPTKKPHEPVAFDVYSVSVTVGDTDPQEVIFRYVAN